ncbi:MAG TPA: formylmethanofuran dehydrogenase subunit E family protein, partial [Bacillota bacterium]|nr:formylmethanofuran dehydrogenase subunit E family protein [Bacillota bacterium]
MDIHSQFDKSAEFHGHRCPGLAIGVRAAAEAQKLLGIDRSGDEEIVCVTENDACGVDGIQVLLGCSAGKGNLIFRIRGKQAFSFFNRTSGEAVRMVLKNLPKMESREAKQNYILDA